MVRGTFQPPRYIPCLAHQEKPTESFDIRKEKCMCIKSDQTDGGSKTLMHAFDRFEDTDLHEKKPKKAKLGKQASVYRT